jgi:CRISPR-associated protein (TIGR03984 family)
MSPFGCAVTPIEADRIAALLAWVRGAGSAPPEVAGSELLWLLAFSDTGVTWGRIESGVWKLSAAAFPGISPELLEIGLHELRLFGRHAELRLWRNGRGFTGRRIEDRSEPEAHPAVTPREDRWVLAGDRSAAVQGGFALVTGRAGRRQALPLVVPEGEIARTLPWRLEVRHYFEQSPETGAVRVALTRLLDVVPGEPRSVKQQGDVP